MSFVNQLKEPLFAATAVAVVVVGAIIGFVIADPETGPSFGNFVVGGLISLLVVGGIYVLYVDYIEKQKSNLAEIAKEDELKARIAAQAKVEAEKGKCISCLTELPADAENCPKCGFAVKHYSTDE
ncbi:MAG: hypothetical protein ACXAE3_13640 [Candidatus Kariarchaeaceae archaeon]|jgi:ribosomal protein L40E